MWTPAAVGVLTLFVAGAALAERATFEVVDENDDPVRNALVIVYDGQQEVARGRTDRSGLWSTELDEVVSSYYVGASTRSKKGDATIEKKNDTWKGMYRIMIQAPASY